MSTQKIVLNDERGFCTKRWHRRFPAEWMGTVLLLAALLPSAGCGRQGRSELLVGAASSLRAPLEDAVIRYNASRPAVDIVLSFAGSGTVRRQIEFGAPIDVFLSAATEYVDTLVVRGFVVPGSRQIIASNTLVVVTPVQRAPLAGIFDLRLPTVARIAMGEPRTVPAGRYAQQTLARLGLGEDVAEKLVYTKDVTQVLTYVYAGIVDAGFVYLSDVENVSSIRVLTAVPDSLHDRILYEGVVIATSRHQDEAARFLHYLRSDSLHAVFIHHGFGGTPSW